ncbi:MAG: nicotinate phosphoribosyltransferase [Thermomicrobiales bacterium]|nr:nicotinate phosphoribosyltransferase [Thermomicrobiales bacterium]
MTTWPIPGATTGLFVDLYHLDAAYVSWRSGENAPATFDLYTRSAPFGGAYLLAAGLELALAFVRDFRYTEDDLAWLAALKGYDPAFLDELRRFRFSGDILAMPEGTVAFADEPLVRVTAPFRDALLLESGLLRAVGVSTLIATKAARLVDAAEGRAVADFGFRRAHDPFLASRSAMIGGCASTSFVEGAKLFNVPSTGTIPHALVQAYPTEEDAFRAVAETLDGYSLLLDTYDVHTAIETAVSVAKEGKSRFGHEMAAVRLDSGDLLADSIHVRRVLDDAGLPEVKVLVSGDIDEFRIVDLLAAGAPIDGFGVGGNLAVGLGTVGSGAVGGVLGAVYKLAWYEGAGDPARIKLAGSKTTWPGRKFAYRIGDYEEDVIQLDDEPAPPDARPLLEPAIRDGDICADLPSVLDIRSRALANVQALPERYRALTDPPPYPVRRSEGIVALRERASQQHTPNQAVR